VRPLLHNEGRTSWFPQQEREHILGIYQRIQFRVRSGRGKIDALPTLLAFVDVGVKVNIGDVTVEHRTSSLDHAIRKLWARADCVSVGHFQRGQND
jgi:hypothetical protein